MAAKTCPLCGAGFDGPGAAEAYVTHVTAFHPGTDAAAKADAPAPGEVAAAEALAAEHTRAELNELATGLGVKTPEELPNKAAVAEAILAAQAAGGAG